VGKSPGVILVCAWGLGRGCESLDSLPRLVVDWRKCGKMPSRATVSLIAVRYARGQLHSLRWSQSEPGECQCLLAYKDTAFGGSPSLSCTPVV
jgi:hypothetical protein